MLEGTNFMYVGVRGEGQIGFTLLFFTFRKFFCQSKYLAEVFFLF